MRPFMMRLFSETRQLSRALRRVSVTHRLAEPVSSTTSREGYREVIQTTKRSSRPPASPCHGGEVTPCEPRGYYCARWLQSGLQSLRC